MTVKNQKYNYTRKTYDFYSIKYGTNDFDLAKLESLLSKTEEKLKKGVDVNFIKCKNNLYVAISQIKKITREDDSYYWIVNFTKAETEKDTSIVDIKKDVNKGRIYYVSDENQGPATDTVVILDTQRNLVVMTRNRDGFGRSLLWNFIYKTTRKQNCSIDVLVDNLSNNKNKVRLMNKPQVIELRIQKLADIKKLESPKTPADEMQNLLQTSYGEKITIKVESEKSFGGKVVDIVESVLSLKKSKANSSLEVNKLTLYGEHDDEPQVIDLISNRITFIDEKVRLDDRKKLTIQSMMNSIQNAYESRNKETLLYIVNYKEKLEQK